MHARARIALKLGPKYTDERESNSQPTARLVVEPSPKMPDFKVSTQIYSVECGFDRLGMGREDEYFWKTSKERKEEDTVDMYHSQDGRYADP